MKLILKLKTKLFKLLSLLFIKKSFYKFLLLLLIHISILFILFI